MLVRCGPLLKVVYRSYPREAPHVGHLYSMVLADILKRWNVLRGRHAFLCTGTDEHGMKVQRAATQANCDAQSFCDQGAETFKELAKQADISNDYFIRTTDSDHKEAVQYAWKILQERGMIYLSKHEGWYSVSDETYYPQSAVHLIIEPPTGRKIMASIETGKEVEWTSEVNYRFRLSAMKDELLKFYKANPEFVVPMDRMKDVVQQVSEGLEDLSISRPSARLSWGIPVPEDDSQTIYVWLDALINYITKAGYPWAPEREYSKGWPADCHVVGKDIVRFHCIYWPAFLIALGIPPARQVLTHAHWTLGREKMAKSTGNVVNPFFAIARFESDVMRYYLARDGGIAQDADYSNEYIISRYKTELQGGLGNLVSRIVRGKGWDVRRAVQRAEQLGADTNRDDDAAGMQKQKILDLPGKVADEFNTLQSKRALKEIMDVIFFTNSFMQHTQPWALAKDIKTSEGSQKAALEAQLDWYIFNASEALRLAAILLWPFMPNKAEQLADMLGVAKDRRSSEWAQWGKDFTYGTSMVDVGAGTEGTLFPPLINEA